MHVNPVCTDTGLAVVAEFARNGAFDRGIQIGVIEHDKGRVAAQLHRTFHHLIGSLFQQDAPNFGRTGEGQLAHNGVFAEFLANLRGRGRGDNRQEPLGNPRFFGEFRHGQRRKRGKRRRPHHERTPRGKRGGHLAGDHRIRKVPWRDPCGNAYRLFQHRDPLVGHMAGDGFAVDALGLFAEPFHEGCAIGDFTAGFGQRFALFGSHDDREVFLMRHHQIKPPAQDFGALFGRQCRPGFLGGLCGVDGSGHLGARQIRHVGNHIAAGGVDDVESLAAGRRCPFASQKGRFTEKIGTRQHGFEVGGFIEHSSLPGVCALCDPCRGAA